MKIHSFYRIFSLALILLLARIPMEGDPNRLLDNGHGKVIASLLPVKENRIVGLYEGESVTVAYVTSSEIDGSYTTGHMIPVEVAFSAPVTLNGTLRLTLSTGISSTVDLTFSNLPPDPITSTSFTFDYTVMAGDSSEDLNYASTGSLVLLDGTLQASGGGTVDLFLPSLTDANSLAGRKNIRIDTASPSVSLHTTASNPTNTTPIPVTVHFSEVVNDFDSGGITVTGATLSNFSGSGQDYSFDLTDPNQGSVTAHIAAGKAHDVAGNANIVSDTLNVEYDSLGPTVTLNSSASANTNTAPIPVTVTFSESVTGFTAGSITAANASVDNFSGSGASYTFDLINPVQGTVSVSIAGGVAQDAAGNPNTASTVLSRTFDSVAPTITFDLTTGSDSGGSSIDNLTNAATLVINAVFSEAVTGLTYDDLSNIGGATGCLFSVGAASENTYPITITSCSEGSLIPQLAANRVSDAAGNKNVQTDGLTVQIDRTRPMVTLSTAGNPTNSNPVPVNASFTESVTGLALGEIAATGGVAGNLSGSGDSYSYSLTPSSQGAISTHIPAGAAQDMAGNDNQLSNTLEVIYDSIKPTVTFDLLGTSDSGDSNMDDITNASILTFDAAFDEPVTDFTAGDLSIVGTALYCSIQIDGQTGNTYTLRVSSCQEGTFFLRLAADGVADAAGNKNDQITSGFSVTIDRTGPDVSLTTSAGSRTSLNPIPLNISFTEPVTGLAPAALNFVNATAGALSGSGTAYSLPLTPLGQGLVSASVTAGAAHDVAGNGSAASNLLSLTYDSQGPTVTLGSSAPTNTHITPIPVSVTFSEAVSGFGLEDIDASNATPANLLGSGASYTFDLSSPGQGTVTVSIKAGGALDAANNPNTASDLLTRYFDNIPPSVSLETTAPNPTNTAPIPVTVTFSESVTGFTAGSITATNASVDNFSGSGASYTFDLINPVQGTVSASIAGGVAQDAAGNPNTASTVLSRTFDSTGPTVTITSTAPDPTRTAPIPFTVTFSESVSDFDQSDLILTNATVSSFSGSGMSYSINLSPSSQGTVTLSIAAGVAHDSTGNANSASDPLSRTYDTVAPTVLITSPVGDPTNQSPILVTVTFSEPVTGFDFSDLKVSSHGTATSFSGSGAVYTFSLALQAQFTTTVDILADAAQDAAGNLSTAAPQFTRTHDTAPPSVSFNLETASDTGISSTDDLTNAVSPVFDAIFTEAVTGFEPADLTNIGTALNCAFHISGPTGSTYAVTASSCGEGTLIPRLGAGLVTDLAGNPIGLTDGLTVSIDRTAPTVALSTSVLDPTNANPIPVSIVFSEAVNGFTSTDLTLVNGSTTAITGSGPTYSFNLVPGGQGAVSTSIAAAVAQDTAGNDNAASNLLSRTYDSILPTVSLTSGVSSPTNTSPIAVTVTFSEAVADFIATDLNLTNATVGAFSGSGDTYTVELIPGGQGLVNASIAPGAAHDAAGNANTASNTLSWTYDSSGPTVSLASTAPDPTNTSPIPVTVTFGEAVTDFEAGDISYTNATLSGFSGSGTGYSFNLTPTGQGPVTASIAVAAAHDSAGNASSASNSFSRTYDSLNPTVTLTTGAPDPTNTAPIPVTVTFSEPVTNFVAGDIIATNATVSGFSGSQKDYSFTLINPGQGTVSASIAGGVAQDAANNLNTASNTLSLVFDNIAPTVVFDLLDGSDTGTLPTDNITRAASLDFTAAFSEAVNGFVDGDLNNGGTATGCIFQVSTPTNNVYPVTATSCSEGSLIIQMAVGKVHDPAGNPNALAAGPSVTIDRTAPTVSFDLQAGSDHGPFSTDDITNAVSPVFDALFSETVAGLESTDFINAGMATTCVFSVGTTAGTIYPITVSNCTAGTLILRLKPTTVIDIAGNANAQTDGPTVTLDRTAPTVTFDLEDASDSGPSNTDNLTNAPNPIIDAIFTEAISGLTSGDFLNSGSATGCTFTVGAANVNTYPVTASSCSEGTIILNLTGSSIMDIAGNGNEPAASPAITIDRTAPTGAYTLRSSSDSGVSPSDRITNAASLSFDSAFSEPVWGFEAGDLINTGNATLCSFGISGPTGNNYLITADACSEGSLIVHTIAGAVTDMAGNNLPSVNSPAVTIDRTAPTVGFGLQTTSDSGPVNNDNYTNSTAPVSNAVFSEAVSPLTGGSLTNFGTANGCSFSIGLLNGNTYPVTASSCGEGTLILRLGAGGVTDIAGNPILLTDGPIVTIDRTLPTVSMNLQAASDTGFSSTDNLTNASVLVFNAGFTEAVFGFDQADLSRQGTSSGCGFSVGGLDAGSYPVTVSGCTPGTVVVRLAASGVMDLAGNLNARTDSPTITIDRTPPTVSMSSTANEPTGISPIPVSVVFSEPVTLFTTSSVGTVNGTINEFAGSGANYTFNLYPAELGTVTASILTGAAQDLAGNNNTAALPFSRTYDNVAPLVSMTSAAPATTHLSPIPVTVTFSKSVTGFVSTEITVANGSISNFQGSGAAYSFNLIPAGQGTVSADIAANVAQDSAGNGNTAAPQFTRVYDSLAPTVTFDLQDASDMGTSNTDNLTNAISPVFNAVFSETITDFSAGDVSNVGTATGCTFTIGTAQGNTYPVTAASCSNGTIVLRIPLNAVLDAAQNGNAQTNGPTITIDRTAPTVNITLQSSSDTGVSNSDHVTNAASPVFDVSFSKPVFTLENTDFVSIGSATGCSISVGTASVNTYPVTVSSCTEGTLNLRLSTAMVMDAAGNLNPQKDGPLTTMDRTAPVFLTAVPAPGDYINNVTTASDISYSLSEALASGSLTMTWSGGVSDPGSHTCALAGSALNAGSHASLNLSDTGNGCTTVQALVSNARYLFTFDGSDIAGNPALQVQRANVTFDETAPTISLSAPSVAGTRNGPVSFTVTYSDLNFNASTLTTGNISLITTGSAYGTVSVSGSGTIRTVTITNTGGNGTLAISIAGGTASDRAGNLAPASGPSTTFIVDIANPRINWTQPVTDQQIYTTYNQVVHLEVNASDNIGISKVVFYQWDYLANGGDGAEVEIGTVYNAPYGLDYDSSGLYSGANEIDAFVYDLVGNYAVNVIWLNDIPSLKVIKSGSGQGSVTSAPTGIDCGSTCIYGYTSGTQVTLTASPSPTSVFEGWSGACTGTGVCQVTLGTDKTVTATFTYINKVYLPLITR